MKLSEAPGCIGSPIIRSENATLCKSCTVRTVCGQLAVRTAARLARELGVEAIDPRQPGRAASGGKHVDIKLAHRGTTDTKAPSAKSRALVAEAAKRGLDGANLAQVMALPPGEFAAAVRPIKPAHLRLAMICLRRGAISRAALRDQFEKSLGLPRLSAQGLVSTTLGALTLLGLARIEDGLITKDAP